MSTKIVKDTWKVNVCHHPEHNPPSHIVIPQGHKLEHTCPGCGKVIVIKPAEISMR